jgi:hypothetical protein
MELSQTTATEINNNFENITANINSKIKSCFIQEHSSQQISLFLPELSFFDLDKEFDSRKAKFIYKLHYWIKKCGKIVIGSKGLWIYNNSQEWANQLNCSLSTIKRIIYYLEEQQIILSKKVKAKIGNHTKWYSINYEKLSSVLSRNQFEYNSGHDLHSNFTTKDTPQSHKNKWNIRSFHFEPIYISNNNNNYTNNSSNKKNIFKTIKDNIDIRFNKLNKSIEEKLNNKINKKLDFERDIENSKSQKLQDLKSDATTALVIKEKLNEATKMKTIWNKIFETSLRPIKAYTNQKNIILLSDILQKYFDNDLDKWREYALKVNSSKFLMGEKETQKNFKATFSWLIKPDTIEKIMNNEYGVGDRELDMNNLDKNIKTQEYEIKEKATKKIFTILESKIDIEKEKEEFKEYLLNERYEEDKDKYKVKNYIEKVSKYSFYGFYVTPAHFYYPENAKQREKLFNAYMMNKYLGADELTIQDRLKEISKAKERKNIIFAKMKKLGDNLRNFSLTNNNILEIT